MPDKEEAVEDVAKADKGEVVEEAVEEVPEVGKRGPQTEIGKPAEGEKVEVGASSSSAAFVVEGESE